MILLTGGSGLLGTELQKHMSFWAPSHAEFDILNPSEKIDAELIVHCAAYTDVTKAERDREACYRVNVDGTRNMASYGIPMIYISTDSVFDGKRGKYNEQDSCYPVNHYSDTKWKGELELRNTCCSIIRTSFKKSPWQHTHANTNRFTSAGYVAPIARQIIDAIQMFRSLPRIIHIGFDRCSHYEMALMTKPDVIPTTQDFTPDVPRPMDSSLDYSLWKSIR